METGMSQQELQRVEIIALRRQSASEQFKRVEYTPHVIGR